MGETLRERLDAARAANAASAAQREREAAERRRLADQEERVRTAEIATRILGVSVLPEDVTPVRSGPDHESEYPLGEFRVEGMLFRRHQNHLSLSLPCSRCGAPTGMYREDRFDNLGLLASIIDTSAGRHAICSECCEPVLAPGHSAETTPGGSSSERGSEGETSPIALLVRALDAYLADFLAPLWEAIDRAGERRDNVDGYLGNRIREVEERLP